MNGIPEKTIKEIPMYRRSEDQGTSMRLAKMKYVGKE